LRTRLRWKSFIEERGEDLDLAGHTVWHERETPELKIVWELWKAGYERSYHGSNVGVINLGELS
jgi:hypothetical protein